MDKCESVKDYLHDKLETALYNSHILFNSCTISTIRWLKRYSHCYSILCSCFCIPLWILILPIAIVFDICIYIITFIVFLIAFIIYLFFSPYILLCRFGSCLDACNPVNIYRHSLTQALNWAMTIVSCFDLMWSCYCGTGEIDNGAPFCCIYCCCTECHRLCNQATHIEINDAPCTIL